MSTSTVPAPEAAPPLTGQLGQVILATVTSMVGFWAWMIISPLAVTYTAQMHLTSSQKSMLIATPVLVGSLGRVVVGALTDRFGGRIMFVAVLLSSLPAVLLVAWAGTIHSYPLMLVFGFWLGVAGTIFAVGVPFSNAWYEPHRRGFSAGVFGMGMIGTAVSAFFTPRLVKAIGYVPTHLLVAGLMVVMSVVVWFAMKESPRRVANHDPLVPKVLSALKEPITWEMSFLYAVAFGGFVAFSTYLPTYLKDIYAFDLTSAGTRTAGFAVAAVVARPIGGVLADRLGPKVVTAVSLGLVAVLAFVVSLQPQTEVATGATFLAMAAALGLGMGAIFGWIGRLAPQAKVGAITGVVAAAGGLGGYVPPIIMGATYDPVHKSYAIGLWLLVATAAAALLLTLFLGRQKKEAPAA